MSFKRNSNRKVVEANRGLIFPEQGHEKAYRNIKTVAFTSKDLEKLDRLKAKYKISRSALVRILLDNYPEMDNE